MGAGRALVSITAGAQKVTHVGSKTEDKVFVGQLPSPNEILRGIKDLMA
jgi:hypothetical protein